MAKEKLKKQLYHLMANSRSIQSLTLEERLAIEEKILILPEGDMRKMIDVFKREQKQITQLQRRSLMEQKEVKKISSAINALRDAGRTIKRIFLTVRESAEREESTEIASSLLRQIDKL